MRLRRAKEMGQQGQFETRQLVALQIRPPFPRTTPVYVITNRTGDQNFIPFDYESTSADTVGFSQPSSVLRFFESFYKRPFPEFPLRDLIASDFRRWEIVVTREGSIEPLQVNTVKTSSAGAVLELGSPLHALTYPSHPVYQFI